MKIGDRIQLIGTDWEGTIINIISNNIAIVLLDNGIEMHTPFDRITIMGDTPSCNTERDERGRFVAGHKKLGIKRKLKNVRQTRKELLEQLQPYISDIGSIIALIDAPEDKILAITRMMKFCVPTYSSVEFSETTPRSLTAEEKLVQLNAKYNNLPDPTETNLEDEENDVG